MERARKVSSEDRKELLGGKLTRFSTTFTATTTVSTRARVTRLSSPLVSTLSTDSRALTSRVRFRWLFFAEP